MHIVHVMLGFADVHSIHIADLAELLHQISPDADTAEAMDFYSGGYGIGRKRGAYTILWQWVWGFARRIFLTWR